MEQLSKLIDTNHLETWEDVRAFEEKQTEVLAQQEQIQRKSSRVATDLARLSVFKGNLREIEVQQRVDEQAREQNREKKHENTI